VKKTEASLVGIVLLIMLGFYLLLWFANRNPRIPSLQDRKLRVMELIEGAGGAKKLNQEIRTLFDRYVVDDHMVEEWNWKSLTEPDLQGYPSIFALGNSVIVNPRISGDPANVEIHHGLHESFEAIYIMDLKSTSEWEHMKSTYYSKVVSNIFIIR
jgi:hypothetical protein